MRLVLDSADLLYRYLTASQGDLIAAASKALADADAATQRIAELAGPYDAFDALESVRLYQTPLNPESYRETEDEHSAAVIELCARVLGARGQRLGTLPDVDGHRARADSVIDEILEQCSTALALGSMVSLMRLTDEGARYVTPTSDWSAYGAA
jgi:hypothetical protein